MRFQRPFKRPAQGAFIVAQQFSAGGIKEEDGIIDERRRTSFPNPSITTVFRANLACRV